MRRVTKHLVSCALSAALTVAVLPASSLAYAAGTGESTETTAATETATTTGTSAETATTADQNVGTTTSADTAAAQAAAAVSKQIKALPSVSKVAASDYDAIMAAANAYAQLAQPELVSEKLTTKLNNLKEAVLYAAAPALTYKVKSTSGKTTTVSDDKAHTFKGGIGKIQFSQPKSSVNSKTSLSGEISFGIRTYGKKTVTSAKTGKWLGSTSSKNVEQGFKLKFSGTVSEYYTVYYRVNVSKLGWSDWASDGAWAGSTGMGLRITGLQVQFVKKGSSAPGSTANATLSKSTVKYRVNTVKGGWTSYKTSGKTAGTASWTAGIEQVDIESSGDLSGSVQSSVLTRKGKWTSYKTGTSGSTGKSQQAQAIRIKLTGQLAKVYNVYYRVYASDYYWLGWAKNGEKAGTQGHKYSMGAIQIRLKLKGTGAPGSTSKHFTTKAVPWSSGGQLTMTRKAQGYSSSTGWLVLVNRSTTHVGVFKGSKGSWKLVKYFICDVGASSTPTPKGTRHVQYRIPSFGEEKGYSVYKATNIGGGYYFHSILYYANTRSVMDGTLGAWCSHGCIRLAYSNAKYIYDNVSNGTTVKIY